MASETPGTTPTSRIPKVVVILAVLVLACIAVSVCVILLLTLMAPAVGNVFSNIITTLGTPTP